MIKHPKYTTPAPFQCDEETYQLFDMRLGYLGAASRMESIDRLRNTMLPKEFDMWRKITSVSQDFVIRLNSFTGEEAVEIWFSFNNASKKVIKCKDKTKIDRLGPISRSPFTTCTSSRSGQGEKVVVLYYPNNVYCKLTGNSLTDAKLEIKDMRRMDNFIEVMAKDANEKCDIIAIDQEFAITQIDSSCKFSFFRYSTGGLRGDPCLYSGITQDTIFTNYSYQYHIDNVVKYARKNGLVDDEENISAEIKKAKLRNAFVYVTHEITKDKSFDGQMKAAFEMIFNGDKF